MPQLPGGRQIAISPEPLNALLMQANHFGNIHKVMAIKSVDDLLRYIDVLRLVPEADAGGESLETNFTSDSLPVPAGLVCVPSGHHLSDWKAYAADWPEEDKAAFLEFLSGRAAPLLDEYLEAVVSTQEKLRGAEDFLTKVLVGWWEAGCHPAQEEGWDASDVGSPDWDDYDMLAALGLACAVLPQHEEFAAEQKTLWMLQSYWNIVRFDLQPRLVAWPELSASVRDNAIRARQAGWLAQIDESKRSWLHENGVSVCVQLWSGYGDRLRAALPQPYGIIELVVVSPDAIRYCDGKRFGISDSERQL